MLIGTPKDNVVLTVRSGRVDGHRESQLWDLNTAGTGTEQGTQERNRL